MTYSLNELQALSKRAARGAGLSWGLAEDAGKALRWLASNAVNATPQLAALLKEYDHNLSCDIRPTDLQSPWTSAAGWLCPISTGATLSDCAGLFASNAELTLASVKYPLLLAGFAADIARQRHQLVGLQWDDVHLHTDGQTLFIRTTANTTAAQSTVKINLGLAPTPDTAQPRASRIALNKTTLDQLTTFAHRTYAPATDESRRRGAG
jgi:hypothetical protein